MAVELVFVYEKDLDLAAFELKVNKPACFLFRESYCLQWINY